MVTLYTIAAVLFETAGESENPKAQVLDIRARYALLPIRSHDAVSLFAR